MVESTGNSFNKNKPIILAMGTLGVGKSTVMNKLLGDNNKTFAAKR